MQAMLATIYFLLIPQLPYILLHDRLTDGSIYDTHKITFSLFHWVSFVEKSGYFGWTETTNQTSNR